MAFGPRYVTAHVQPGDTISRIIVPLDGSSLAETALPFAEELARRLSLGIVLARVIDTGGPYTGLRDDATNVKVDPGIKSAALRYLNTLRWKLAEKGQKVRTEVLVGTPAERISNLAEVTADNVVVMTTRGRSGLARLAKGSVTESVIRSSGHPVLVIPPPVATSDG